MENVFCSLYTQNSVDPAAEKRALQELLMHLGQETAQQQIERHSSSVRLDGLICKALEAASEHTDFSADELEHFCREMAGETGRKLPLNRFELIHLGERFLHRSENCGLRSLIYGGLKGIAEYGMILSGKDVPEPEITGYLKNILAYLLVPGLGIPEMTELVQDCGRMCLKTFHLLSEKYRQLYGIPRPVRVRISPVPGKAVLVMGQDYRMLDELLKLAKERNIRIYTHGELITAHTYPHFQEYWQLAGHYGSTWLKHRAELADFPGAVLLTSGCFRPELDGIRERTFSCGTVWSAGIPHLRSEELFQVLDKAEELDGFALNVPEEFVSAGYGHEILENSLPGIISMIERGALRHICVIGGCDRVENDDRYFAELVQQMPQETLILSFGCCKMLFHREIRGLLGEFPRMLDLGQCSDVYSIIHFFHAMAGALNTDVRNLPVSLFVGWNQERAIPAILALAAGGFDKIFIGSGVPSDILDGLQELGRIRVVTTPENDMKQL